MWTTCPQCRGSGFESVVEKDATGAVHLVHEDECRLCHGDGGIYVEPEEDDLTSLEDVDVKDED